MTNQPRTYYEKHRERIDQSFQECENTDYQQLQADISKLISDPYEMVKRLLVLEYKLQKLQSKKEKTND